MANFTGTGEAVTVDAAGVETGQIDFQSDGFSLAGGPVTLGVGTITTATSTTATVNSVLDGVAGVLKAGDGTLILGASNTFTGGLTLAGWQLGISADANLGDSSSGIALAGGTLVPSG